MEDYLECIHRLSEPMGFTCVSDIATALELNRPSVSLMTKRLSDLGFLSHERYRGISLTEKGRRLAEDIAERHAMLTELFELIGLDPAQYHDDIEGIEHHLSGDVYGRFLDLVRHLRTHPVP